MLQLRDALPEELAKTRSRSTRERPAYLQTRLVQCQTCGDKGVVQVSSERGRRLRNRRCLKCGGRVRSVRKPRG